MKTLKISSNILIAVLLLLLTNSCTRDWNNPYDELGNNNSGDSSTVPIAAFNANKTAITTGKSVIFTDQSTNTPTNWAWDFGDGGTSTLQNPTHAYSTQGSFTVTLTAGNSFGADTKTKTNYITVSGTLAAADLDGNIYSTVTIGTQVWMVENLKTTKYNDGTDIPLVTDDAIWAGLTTPGYCWYNNDITNKSTYGALYNFSTVNTGKLAPQGWHVATDAEWTTLISFVANDGHSGTEGAALKAINGWDIEGNGTDNYDFSSLPGGFRDNSLSYLSKGTTGFWWSYGILWTDWSSWRNSMPHY